MSTMEVQGWIQDFQKGGGLIIMVIRGCMDVPPHVQSTEL